MPFTTSTLFSAMSSSPRRVLALLPRRLRGAPASDHEQVLVAVLRRTSGRSAVCARGELEEVAVERSRAVGLLGEARVEPDHRPERLLEELAIIVRAVRSSPRSGCESSPATPPGRRRALARAPRCPTRPAVALRAGARACMAPGRRRSRQIKPSGVKLSIPIVPPGRHTRSSSSATAAWSGAKIAPNEEVTTSNSLSCERERLGVGLDPFELDPVRLGFAAARFEVLGRQVRGHYLGPGLGGADRSVARPGGDVEHALPRGDPARPDQHLPELPDGLLREPVVVAEGPGGPRGGLQLAVRLDRHGHVGFLVVRHLAPPPVLSTAGLGQLVDPGESRGLDEQSPWGDSALHGPTVATAARPDFARTEHLRAGPAMARSGYPGVVEQARAHRVGGRGRA